MKRYLATAGALTLAATTADAGGIERSIPSIGALYEEGQYAEFSFASVSPTVSGVFGGAVSSGDVLPSYETWSLTYKTDFNDKLAFALTVDTPYGADVAYPIGTGYPFAGSTATVKSIGVRGMLRYNLGNGFNVHGGLRLQSLDGNILLPAAGGPYALNAPAEWDLGYALGVAYTKPEIAMRVALTYYSEVDHTFRDNGGTAFDVTTPQSLNLEFQTGIAEDTLLFGTIRYTDWPETVIHPPEYPAPLVSYSDSRMNYTLGLGRRFNERWSGAVILGHEPSNSGTTGNLGPTNGSTSISLAATYTMDNMKITGGVSYINIGNATTSTIGARFTGNDAIGFGIKLSSTF